MIPFLLNGSIRNSSKIPQNNLLKERNFYPPIPDFSNIFSITKFLFLKFTIPWKTFKINYPGIAKPLGYSKNFRNDRVPYTFFEGAIYLEIHVDLFDHVQIAK